ncbi:RelA/SpoT family protein, partial [bacterium]|nr:RelA/SpoT family protein [bacterium]MBU1024653.1 RelA/SpoT family protein [bacterium]
MNEKSVEITERKKLSGPVCKSNLPNMLDGLMENILANEPSEMDYDLIARAYFFADKAHKGEMRKSGDPYISHPVAVANILADLRADDKMLAAALLHDVIEDTDVNYPEVEEAFGTEIAQLVDGVTKLSRMNFTSYQERKAENARKMIFAITKDISVILIKLADRFHNLKTLQYLSEEKQKHIAQDTLDFYAPLAHRLGIYQMKNEMEDLAFKHLMPEEYAKISKQVAGRKDDRDKEVKSLIQQIKNILKPLGIEAEIQGRAKHLYSIYMKMERDGLDFDQIMDLIALRVIVPELKDCYTAVGIIRSVWKPMTEKIKDYIASPKTNMYRSLHTIVMGPQQKPVEIQIRTVDMHRIAEYGISAHWLYKEGKERASDFDQHLTFFRRMVDWQSGTLDSEDFMESLKLHLLN